MVIRFEIRISSLQNGEKMYFVCKMNVVFHLDNPLEL